MVEENHFKKLGEGVWINKQNKKAKTQDRCELDKRYRR
jgi:hypothetical protein